MADSASMASSSDVSVSVSSVSALSASTFLASAMAPLVMAANIASMMKTKEFWAKYADDQRKGLIDTFFYLNSKLKSFSHSTAGVYNGSIADIRNIAFKNESVQGAANAQDAARLALDVVKYKEAMMSKMLSVCQAYSGRSDAEFNKHLQQLQADIGALQQQAANIQQFIANIPATPSPTLSSSTSLSSSLAVTSSIPSPTPLSSSMASSLFASSSMVSSVSPMPMPSVSSFASSSLAFSSAMPSASSQPIPDYIANASQNLEAAHRTIRRLTERFQAIRVAMSPDVEQAEKRANATIEVAKKYAAEGKAAETATASIMAISEAKNTITLLKEYCISVREGHGDSYQQADHIKDFESLLRLEYSLDSAASTLRSQKNIDYPSSVSISSSPIPSASSTAMSSSMVSSAILTPSSTPISSSTAIPMPGSKEDYAARAIQDYNQVTFAINYFSQRYRDLGLSGNPQDVFSTALTAQSELQTAALAAQSSTDAKSAADYASEAASKAKIAFNALNIKCQGAFRSFASESDNLANLAGIANFVITKEQALNQEIASRFPAVSPPPSPSSSVSVASSSMVSSSRPTPPSHPAPLTADEKKEQAAQEIAREQRIKLYFLSSPEGRREQISIIRQDEIKKYNALQQISGGIEARTKAHNLIQIPSNDPAVVAADRNVRAQLENQAAKFWSHYLDRLEISRPRSGPEYTAQLNEKAKYLGYVVTNYGIVLVPNPAKPNDPFPWFHSQKASDEFVSNMGGANSKYVQVLSGNRAAACGRVPELRGKESIVGNLATAHVILGRHALEAGVDVSSIRMAGISRTDTFVKRAENELSTGRDYSSLSNLASGQLSIFERWSNDPKHRPSWGDPVSPYADNMRVAITQGKDGGLRLVVTTFDPAQKSKDSFDDQTYWHCYTLMRNADKGITSHTPECSSAEAQRQALAAFLGSKNDKALRLNYTPGSGSSHQELMRVWNGAIQSGKPPSMSVFLAMISYSGQKVKTGFFGFSTADKGTVYRKHLLNCFGEIRNPQARVEAVFNFTTKADQEMRAALNDRTANFTPEQHQQYMESWLASIQAHDPQLAQAVAQRAAARVEQIRGILQTETDSAKIGKLVTEVESAHNIVNCSGYQPQITAVSNSVTGIAQIPKVHEYLQGRDAKIAEQAEHDQDEEKELKAVL